MAHMQFTIQPHMHTRKTQYPMYKLLNAIYAFGLTHERPAFLIRVSVPLDADVIKRFEQALKLVHRNIPYTKEVVQ